MRPEDMHPVAYWLKTNAYMAAWSALGILVAIALALLDHMAG